MQLMIGSTNTSSWSMRAWIVMREKGIPFEEVSVPIRDLTRARSVSAPACHQARCPALWTAA